MQPGLACFVVSVQCQGKCFFFLIACFLLQTFAKPPHICSWNTAYRSSLIVSRLKEALICCLSERVDACSMLIHLANDKSSSKLRIGQVDMQQSPGC